MAKIDFKMTIDSSEMQRAVEKASKALKEFGSAIAEMENAEIKVNTKDNPKNKWWQFGRWFV